MDNSFSSSASKQKNMPPKTTVEADINLHGKVYTPPSYVTDMRLKIDLYPRLARISSRSELSDYISEFTDRFGPPPHPNKHLLSLAAIRLDAHRWQNRLDTSGIHGFHPYFRPTYPAIGRRQSGETQAARCPKCVSFFGLSS